MNQIQKGEIKVNSIVEAEIIEDIQFSKRRIYNEESKEAASDFAFSVMHRGPTKSIIKWASLATIATGAAAIFFKIFS